MNGKNSTVVSMTVNLLKIYQGQWEHCSVLYTDSPRWLWLSSHLVNLLCQSYVKNKRIWALHEHPRVSAIAEEHERRQRCNIIYLGFIKT